MRKAFLGVSQLIYHYVFGFKNLVRTPSRTIVLVYFLQYAVFFFFIVFEIGLFVS